MLTLSLPEAAVLLSSGRGAAGARLQQAVEAQLTRRGVLGADLDDVRADVAFALLVSPRGERLTLDAACAHVARVARNKAIDQHRRRRHESPGELSDQHAAEPGEERLVRDLDVVTGEVHRRAVSRALVQLVDELPATERLALTATASGTGALGSGLGRSSHYRALDRARLRLTAVVRSRIAGGLALPLLLLRNAGVVRDVLAPLGAVAIAGAASVALVLPAIDLPATPIVQRPAATRIAHVTVSLAPQPLARPLRVVQRRARTPLPRPVAPHVVRPVAPVRTAPRPRTTAHVSPARPVFTPDAGLGPCRAALLCK